MPNSSFEKGLEEVMNMSNKKPRFRYIFLIFSILLNAAYFLPIVFMVWFAKSPVGDPDHGEAPWPAVLALTITAALTILFFLFSGPAIALEYQVVEALL